VGGLLPPRPDAAQDAVLSRRYLALGALVLVLGSGCPEDWMIDGTNDRAMRKDIRDTLQDVKFKCAPGEVLEECEPGHLDCAMRCKPAPKK